MGFAEDKMWDYVKSHLDKIQDLPLVDMLFYLAGCFTQPEIEAIQAKLTNDGLSRTAFTFMNELRRRRNWVNEFIRALRKCDRPDLADDYQKIYDGFKLPSNSQISSNIPSPASLPANPERPESDPMPSGIRPPSYSSLVIGRFEPQALRYQLPAYSLQPPRSAAQVLPLGTSSSENASQSQPLPVQQPLSSSTTPGASATLCTPSQEVFEETRSPTQESVPAGGELNTNLTHPTNSTPLGFQHESHLTEGFSNPASQNPKKGERDSRLSQEESDAQPVAMRTVDPSSSFAPFPIGRGRIAYSPNADRVVRRKELTVGNGARNEPSGGQTGKVTETNTQLPHPSPTPGPSNSRNEPVAAPKSQIPRKARDATSSPAIREGSVRPGQSPARIQETRSSTNTGVPLRMDTRDSNEEEDLGLSKPGILNSVQPIIAATQPSASPGESPISSMHTSRLAIDESSQEFPGSESTLNRQRNGAHLRSRNDKTTDHRQGLLPSARMLSGEPSNSSAFTVRSDPLIISSSSTDSSSFENKAPEEDYFLNGSSAASSTAEVPGDYLSDNNTAYTVSLSRNVPDECDDVSSMEDTRRYKLNYSQNPSIGNNDPKNPDSSPSSTHLVVANSQGNGANENTNNNVALYQLLIPAIIVALAGVLVYRSRQT